ncbi:hypothetical protein O9992_03225 [Vibrio lentus]|nr:hypothetical protein [Vibrio lentus]
MTTQLLLLSHVLKLKNRRQIKTQPQSNTVKPAVAAAIARAKAKQAAARKKVILNLITLKCRNCG